MLKDSWRLIPMKLAKMPSALGFKNAAGKEIMYYDMYNYKTIEHINRMTKKELKEYIRQHDAQSLDPKSKLKEKSQHFFENLEKWGCRNKDNTYDLEKYSKIYCEADCKVLQLGLQKWRELFQKIDSRIDVYQFYSLPSIAEYYFRINGCYEGCCQLNGSLGAFFQNFVHGGRVMTRRNVIQHIEKLVQDFDAVSLYASAMALFCGFLKGMPKRISSKQFHDLKHYDGYFLKVVITKVGKHRPFPTMCYTDPKTKTKNWTNEMVGRVCYLDKYGL